MAKGAAKMDVKPTLQVINEAGIEPRPGVTRGQTIKPIVGHPERPTDRVRVALATYEAGTVEQLHWHPIEAFYFVISGHAIVRDFQGNEYEVGRGTSIYAPAGIAGAHEWEVKESLQLVAFRATTDPARKMQFTVDKKTKRSYIDLEELARRGGVSFKSHY
jgi:mannose-6-phosphate isomerase-like protein (cupin superfamily)